MIYVYYVNTDNNFNYVLNKLINSKRTFTVNETKYTRVIKLNKKRIIFNLTGKAEKESLRLLNKVKTDAGKFLDGVKLSPIKSNRIKWYYYNDLKGIERPHGECLKLDLNSAYWTTAQKMEIVAPETLDYYDGIIKDKDDKVKKHLRLKALGSLATIKKIFEYKNGELIKQDIIVNEQLRNLYLHICNHVSVLMNDMLINNNLVYYYWDCIFIDNNKALKSVKEYLRDNGYNFHFDTDVYQIFKGAYLSYLETQLKGIRYPIDRLHIIS